MSPPLDQDAGPDVEKMAEEIEDDARSGKQPAPVSVTPRKIKVGADIHRMIDDAGTALSEDPNVFVRGGIIVRVVEREEEPGALIKGQVGAPIVRPMRKAGLRDALSRVAAFERFDARKNKWVDCMPPMVVAEGLLEREAYPALRTLRGIATAPTLRPDGTIAGVPGYDVATGYLLDFKPDDPITARPTRDDALAARDRLLEIVSDFPFQGDEDRAAWIALVLTLAIRPAIAGAVPMFTLSANTRSSGKSLLADCACTIATGQTAPRATQPTDDDEMGKVLTGIAMAGEPFVLFDNLSRPLGGAKLDAFITGDKWKGRLLSTNSMPDLPIRTVLSATGNNLSPKGDTIRRVLPIRLLSALERPETRSDCKIKFLREHVRAQRVSLARDVVIMAAAWFAAGEPEDPKIQVWGSFEHWSRIVPNICTWVGLADPMRTRAGLEESDPKLNAMTVLLEAWAGLERGRAQKGLTVKELIDITHDDHGQPRNAQADVAAALEALAPGKGREAVNRVALGHVFKSYKLRNIGGRSIVTAEATRTKIARWTVRDGCR